MLEICDLNLFFQFSIVKLDLGLNKDSPVFWQLEFRHRALSAYGILAMEFWHIEF